MAELYKGRGKKEDYKTTLEFLDDVFFSEMEEEGSHFLRLLPKLYNEQYDSAANNMVVKGEDGLRAAVGLYYTKMFVAGEKIKLAGIGNVAVGKNQRGKGYMIDCMNLAIDDIKNSSADMAELGGHRQRYEYFGFEQAGRSYYVSMDLRNLKHVYKEKSQSNYTINPVKPENKKELSCIDRLYKSSPLYNTRDTAELFDILNSWNQKPYTFYNGDVMKGYAIFGNKKEGGIRISEIKAETNEDFIEIIKALINEYESIDLSLPEYMTDYIDIMTPICDGVSVEHCTNISVFNYKKVILAFLKLKAEYTQLVDGEATVLIHGIKGDENLTISVKDGKPCVSETNNKADVELEHLEAEAVLFSISAPKRRLLPKEAQTWLPLPLWLFSADNV